MRIKLCVLEPPAMRRKAEEVQYTIRLWHTGGKEGKGVAGKAQKWEGGRRMKRQCKTERRKEATQAWVACLPKSSPTTLKPTNKRRKWKECELKWVYEGKNACMGNERRKNKNQEIMEWYIYAYKYK